MAKITLPFTEHDWGEVGGWVSVARQDLRVQRFIFRIDTASSRTYLLDNDFISVCKSLGWDLLRDPDIINWIRLNPHFFQEETGKTHCIAGKCNPIFHIKGSYMYLLDTAGQYPTGWKPQQRLYGTFSAQFLSLPEGEGNEDEEGRTSHISLLGVDKLNELRKFVWVYPDNQITLVR